jgi:hypothetical protein
VQTKAKAVIEVVLVFAITLFLVALVGLSPIGRWQRQVTNRVFIEYVVMIAVPLLLLAVARRNLASYGLSARNLSYHVSVPAIAFVPVAIAFFAFAFLNHRQWSGSLIMAGIQIAVPLRAKVQIGFSSLDPSKERLEMLVIAKPTYT